MYLISLRGNILGVDSKKENKPFQIQEVIRMGFHCWVDVWWHENEFYLGTTEPYYPIKPSFLNMFALWSNAMNFETMLKLQEVRAPHFFFYKGEPILTHSNHIISEYLIEGKEENTILFTDEYEYSQLPLKGIISDNIASFKDM